MSNLKPGEKLEEVPGWNGKFFKGPRHTYWWLEKDKKPRPLSGITSVLNVIGKPALVQWAANCAVDYVKETLTSRHQNRITEIDSWNVLLDEARTAHNRKKDTAAGLGTDAHGLIETYIRWSIDNEAGIPSAQLTSTEPRVTEFSQWARARHAQTGFRFIVAEAPLADPKYAIAGTPDFIAEETIDGKTVIVIGDLKTGSGIYDRTYFAQMAAYGYMWSKKNRSKNRVALVIVHCPSQKPDQLLATYWSDDMKGDWQGFKAALYLHRWKDNFARPAYKPKKKP